MMKRWLYSSTVVLVFLLSGCASGSPVSQTGNPQDITVARQVTLAARDIAYSEGELQGMVEQPLNVQFTNEGALAYDFTIQTIPVKHETESGGHAHHTSEADVHLHLEAGEQRSIAFTPTEAGTYEYECTVPDHREAGMIGTLVVGEAAE